MGDPMLHNVNDQNKSSETGMQLESILTNLDLRLPLPSIPLHQNASKQPNLHFARNSIRIPCPPCLPALVGKAEGRLLWASGLASPPHYWESPMFGGTPGGLFTGGLCGFQNAKLPIAYLYRYD
jgi:hypothetical protein